MCEICGLSPCSPRCPNAYDPPAALHCSKCGSAIRDGEEYVSFVDMDVCEDCIDSLSTKEIIEMCGGTYLTAREETEYGY